MPAGVMPAGVMPAGVMLAGVMLAGVMLTALACDPVGDDARPAEADAAVDRDGGAPGDFSLSQPASWSGCAPGAANVCRDLCGRLEGCSRQSSAVCPNILLQVDELTGACESLCATYPPFADRACRATTCEGFLATLIDLIPDMHRARCQSGTDDADTVSACGALYACTQRCVDTPDVDPTVCQSACIAELGERARPVIPILTSYRQCLSGCDDPSSDDCALDTCGCLRDRCLGEGVPCEVAARTCSEAPGEAHGCCDGAEPDGQPRVWRGCGRPGAEAIQTLSCDELGLCMRSCEGDAPCARRCVEQASLEALVRYRRLERCTAACDDGACQRTCLDGTDCQDACGDGSVCTRCRAERDRCRYHELDAEDHGVGGCAGLADCVRECRAGIGDRYCERACRVAASRSASEAFDRLEACLDNAECSLNAECNACAEHNRACQES